MKWLILFILLIFLLMIISVRFKRQITAMIEIWKIFKQFENPPEKQLKKNDERGDIALVKCARCGNWIPSTEALNFRSNEFHCSLNCVEKTVA